MTPRFNTPSPPSDGIDQGLNNKADSPTGAEKFIAPNIAHLATLGATVASPVRPSEKASTTNGGSNGSPIIAGAAHSVWSQQFAQLARSPQVAPAAPVNASTTNTNGAIPMLTLPFGLPGTTTNAFPMLNRSVGGNGTTTATAASNAPASPAAAVNGLGALTPTITNHNLSFAASLHGGASPIGASPAAALGPPQDLLLNPNMLVQTPPPPPTAHTHSTPVRTVGAVLLTPINPLEDVIGSSSSTSLASFAGDRLGGGGCIEDEFDGRHVMDGSDAHDSSSAGLGLDDEAWDGPSMAAAEDEASSWFAF